ncbi:shikimate kinase [Rathayibacter soli]|uniref:shikimate kinase n=1 Tax=Rathayibacter soli TaxID=3144168 RepID=UPI0027E3CB2E|nr:shikimate kinase [Glaciibacter superstes]
MSIVLIGPPAAGKSRVGRRLARRLGLAYIDTDAVIVRDHGAIAEIFASQGESHFRMLERSAVEAALREHAVVSLGGGAVLDQRTQNELRGRAVVLLTIRPEAVAERIANGKRPLVHDLASWQRLVDERTPLYRRLAAFTTDTTYRRVDDVVDEITHWAQEQS